MLFETKHEAVVTQQMETFHVATGDSPLPTDSFLSTAIFLKEKVVEATWPVENARCLDPTAYSGLLGTAFLCLRSYEATGSLDDLQLSSQIVDTCALSLATKHRRDVTFLCGSTGVYALGAVVAHYRDDQERKKFFLDLFMEVARESALWAGPEEGGFGISYELLHGRAGFLFSALFINRYLGRNTIPFQLLKPIVEAVLTGGRAGSGYNSDSCPLMYRWHGTRFLGVASGLAGILHVLLHFPLEGNEREEVEAALWYLVRNRFKEGGNYPSNQGNNRDKLVQWSHGAGGIAILLCKAAQVYAEEKKSNDFSAKALKFHDAAIEAGEVVWRRGLNQKIGLADGIAGNAYTFLSLYRLTVDRVYLNRAEAFAAVLHEKVKKMMMPLDCTNLDEDLTVFSLFHGLAGVACLFFDIASPERSRFPGFEL